MNYQITHSPAFSKLDLVLDKDQQIYAQPKSMLCMTTGLEISAQIGGASGKNSVVGGVKSMMSGESFVMSVFRSKRDGERLTLAPAHVGEIGVIEITPESGMFLTKGAYLANLDGIQLVPKFSGLKGLITKKGLFLIHASGSGILFISSYGAIIRQELAKDELLVVDNEYVLAFSDTIQYELRTASKGLKDSLMSGEGLVNRYCGPGVIYYQTRSRQRASMLSSLLNFSI